MHEDNDQRGPGSSLVFNLNGERVELQSGTFEPDTTLIDYLRTQTRFKGTKLSCGQGGCGACAVVMHRMEDGKETCLAVNSCLRPLASCHGWNIITVEGIGSATQGRVHPIQSRITDFNASQCGFCTPGMVVTTFAKLHARGQDASLQEMESSLDGNLCRCTGYRPLLDACKSFVSHDIEDLGSHYQPLSPPTNHGPYYPSIDQAILSTPSSPIPYPPPLGLLGRSGSLWIQPSTLEELWTALKSHPTAQVLGGNTCRGVYGKDEENSGGVIVSVEYVKELKVIMLLEHEKQQRMVVGAAATLTEFIASLDGLDKTSSSSSSAVVVPLVAHLRRIAGTLVRNVATVGGNIMMARDKLFDSDLATLLVGLAATITTATTSDTNPREQLLEDFLRGEGQSGSVLVIISVSFPLHPPLSTEGPQVRELYRTYRTALRRNNAHALANAAFRVSYTIPTDTCNLKFSQVVLAFGALGSAAARAKKTEEVLYNATTLDEDTLRLALHTLREEIVPAAKTRYRFRLDLISAYLYKFFLSLRADIIPSSPSSSPTSRLLSATIQHQRPLSGGCQRFPSAPDTKRLYQATNKDTRGVQATGEAVFVDDVPVVDGTLYGAYIKSPRTVGVLRAIETSRVRLSPGVRAVITAADVRGDNNAAFLMGPPDSIKDFIFVPIGERVMFHSQPLALVLAETAEQAQTAAMLAEVVFDGFEVPIVTIADARQAASMLGVHDEAKRGDPNTLLDYLKEPGSGVKVVKGKVKGQSQKHFYMEPHTAYAIPDEGRLLVYSSSQSPMAVQEVLSRVLSLPMHDIQIKTRRTGGAFGAKATRNINHAAAAAVASKATRRPVRLTLDRATDMELTGGRHEVEAEYEVAFTPEGIVTALKLQVYLNGGFCKDISFVVCHDMADNIEQAYYFPHLSVDIDVLRTNLPTRTTMRAPGVIQSSFIIESIMEHVASEVKRAPEDVRVANFFHGEPGDETMQTARGRFSRPQPITHFTLPRIWEDLKSSAKYEDKKNEVAEFNKKNRWRKRGLSMTPVKFQNSLFPMQATVNIYRDGTILIHHGGCELGQGIHAKTALAALEVFSPLVDDDLPLSLIRFADTDTDVIPNGGMTAASTTSERATAAVHKAATQLAQRLEPIRQSLLLKKSSSGSVTITWKELVSTALSWLNNVDLSAHVQWEPPVSAYHNYGAALSVVEVDGLTGETTLLSCHIVYDCGRSINPTVDLGQIEGGFVQGVGYYTTEEVSHSSCGILLSKNTWSYKPPAATDIPCHISIQLLDNQAFDKGVLSSKASGEPPLVLSTSVMMAIRGAVGAMRKEVGMGQGFFRLDAPATVERILRACGTQMGHMTLSPEANPLPLPKEHLMEVEVAIAGAGLGGLATAISLRKHGIDAHIFERAPALRDVSQGLVGITPNGMRALELIDVRLKSLMFSKGKYNTEASTKTIDEDGSVSQRIVPFKAHNLSIPWADIQHNLASLVPPEVVHCGFDFAGFDEEGEDEGGGVVVHFQGRVGSVRAKLLVGVDGLFSVVRKGVAPFPMHGGDEVGESGHTNWNAIMVPREVGLPYPHPVVSLTYNKTQPPRFFFLIECGDGRVLWQVRVDDPDKNFTVAPKRGHGRLGLPGVKDRILDLVQDIPDVYDYIAATPEADIFERCLLFRKSLQRYSSLGRQVVLCGDAAHAMHSVRGQGANMTFEDAYVLGECLAAKGVTVEAVGEYERRRIPRANMVQWESNTYYKKQFEKNTSDEWKFKFLNFQSYVMEGFPEPGKKIPNPIETLDGNGGAGQGSH